MRLGWQTALYLFLRLNAQFFPMKIIVAVAFILILGSLGSALVFLMRDQGKSKRTVKALTFRIGFSVALFILILIAHQLGWINPTGFRPG